MAATGFTSRWNGKVLAKLLGIGSGGITLYSQSGNPNISPADMLSLYGSGTELTMSTATKVANPYGINLMSSVGGTVYALGAPVVGRRATIVTQAIGDGTRQVSSTAASATFQSTLASAAFLNFSTIATNTVELIGISTAVWALRSNVGGVTVTTA